MAVEDAYLRLHPAQPPIHSPVPINPDSLVFVDLDASAGPESPWVSKQLRAAPPGFFLAPSTVLVRWPEGRGEAEAVSDQAEGIAQLVQTRAGRRVPVGLVSFPLGSDPRVVWSTGALPATTPPVPELLARARAAELHGLLNLGRAIWQPTAYHYRLPSGEHSNVFVRVADAIGRPRDAVALATWLHAFAEEELGVVVDSPTMVPLVLALHGAMRVEGLAPGPVATLTDYPTNQFEVDQAVADLQSSERLLGLLSVMSTGSVGERMAAALTRQRRPWRLEVLVNRNGRGATALPLNNDNVRSDSSKAWLGLGSSTTSSRSAQGCRLCSSSGQARTVYIDPRSFEAMVLPEPELLVPDVAHAGKSRHLWTRYDVVGGVGVQCLPHPETRDLRAHRELLAVRCYPHALFADPDPPNEDEGRDRDDFLGHVCDRVTAVAQRYQDVSPPQWSPKHCRILVVTETDWASSGFERFLDALARGLEREPWSAEDIVVVPKPFTDVPRARFTDSQEHILVVTVGTVTGSTMQQLLVGLHDVTAGEIGGLVLHARPERSRDWQVLQNSYNRRLDSLWLTYLPWRSPLDEENAMLGRARGALEKATLSDDVAHAADRFLSQREAFTAPAAKDWVERTSRADATSADPYSLFWGMALDPSDQSGEVTPTWASFQVPLLRPGSRYGNRLRAVTTYVAVGAAMQSARVKARQVGAPVWQQFELPAILRSYFDPLIIAALLRWLEPYEAWWGARPEDAENALAEAYARATDADQRILLPELLLAAAQGKIPSGAHDWLRATAKLWREALAEEPVNGENAPWGRNATIPILVGELLLTAL